MFLFSLGIVILVVFIFRMGQLQILQHDDWSVRSTRNHVSRRVLDVKRGSILDRNGAELAISVDTYSVFLFTREVKSLPEAANAMAAVLPMTREEIISRVGDRNGYVPIYPNLEPGLATKLKQLNIPGVNLENNYQRYYPQNHLAAHIVGFLSHDRRGLEGIELLYDKTLRGYPGLAVQENVSLTDSGPSQLRVVRPPMGGGNINLTIDSFIQHTLEAELAKIVEQYDPIDAQAIIMDPHTGDILGMAVLPGYNLNEFNTSKPAHRRNRPVTDIFEPGSGMKLFAVAAALEQERIDHSTRFYCRGYSVINGRRIRCTKAHGLIDVNQAIAESCNTAMAQISQLIDNAALYRTYRKFGFGQPTLVEVPSESSGIFHPPSRWSSFSPSSLAIGQELAVTGLQLVQSYAVIANGGLLVRPKLIKTISSPDQDISQETEPKIIGRVIPASIARWLRKMLMTAVENGTGRQASLDDYTIGGKTSTAQKANPQGGYFNDRVVVSFIGMAPAIEPKVVLLVAVNEPKGDSRTLYGGRIAAPSFGTIMNRVLQHLKVPPDKSHSLTAKQHQLMRQNQLAKTDARNLAKTHEASTPPGKVPDLRGQTIKQALNKLSSLKLKGILEGNGIVMSQQPAPGTPIPDNGILMLSLSPDSPE